MSAGFYADKRLVGGGAKSFGEQVCDASVKIETSVCCIEFGALLKALLAHIGFFCSLDSSCCQQDVSQSLQFHQYGEYGRGRDCGYDGVIGVHANDDDEATFTRKSEMRKEQSGVGDLLMSVLL